MSRWEAHRKPLLEEYRQKKAQMHSRKSDFEAKVAKIKEMRRQMKNMLKDLQSKEEKYRALLGQVVGKKLPTIELPEP